MNNKNTKNVVWGEAIRKARICEGLSQRDLAEKLNCSQAYVNQIEKGLIGNQKFQEIVELLGYNFQIQLTKI
jgi:transcriptional regulator with XRE-family HTH domain